MLSSRSATAPARIVAAALATALVTAALAGCSPHPAPAPTADPGPEAALAALARAITAGDDVAIHGLVCPAGRNDGLSFQENRADLAAADPRLYAIRYRASDWKITARTPTSAVATMTITVEGVPADLPADARQALSASSAPVPLNMFGPGHELTLIRSGQAWLACGPLGVRAG